MTPIVTNSAATMVVTNTHSDSSDRGSDYYKDLMNQYKIDEQFAKTKSDKAKAQKLYQYNYKRYKQEVKFEKTIAWIFGPILVAMVIAIIWMLISLLFF